MSLRHVLPLLLLTACPKAVPQGADRAGDAMMEGAPGSPSVCIAALEDVEPKMTSKQRASWWTGIDALNEGDAVAALGWFTRSGPHPAASAGKAATSLLYGEGNRAEHLMEPLLRAYPEDPCLVQSGALAAQQAGDIETAMARAEFAVALQPDALNPALIRAALVAAYQPDRLEEVAFDLVERFPDAIGGHMLLAKEAMSRQDFATAIPALERLLDLDVPVADMLAAVYRHQGRLGDALRVYAETGERLGDDGKIGAAADKEAAFYEVLGMQSGDTLRATIHTNRGDLPCVLFPTAAPLTVANFVGLSRGTIAWTDPATEQPRTDALYPGTTFHRVIGGFMIQGGDPLGTGIGGPGYRFMDEIDASLKFDRPGVLAMANSGPGTNGSQFFVTVGKAEHLTGRHTIFGQCTADAVTVATAITKVERTGDTPVDPIVIESIEITAARSTLGATPLSKP